MLPEWSLDDEDFNDIVDAVRNKIRYLYPAWTDFNYHDPGITLVELFAWFKESQQYYLDQTSDEMKLKFLKLLGFCREHKRAAYTFAQVRCADSRILPAGTKCYAGQICFETVRKKQVVGGDILYMLAVRGQGEEALRLDYIDRRLLEFGHRIRFFPFGREPESGDACYIAFSSPLPQNQPLRLYVDIWEDYTVKRNKLRENLLFPMAGISIRYCSKDGWKEVCRQEDLTYGFLQDGFLSFCLRDQAVKATISGLEAYWICMVLTGQDYDIPPCITRASINIEEVRQTETLSEMQDALMFRDGTAQKISQESYLAMEGRTRVFYRIQEIYAECLSFQKSICRVDGRTEINIDTDAADSNADGIRIVHQDSDFAGKYRNLRGNGLPCQRIRLEESALECESLRLMIRDGNEGRYTDWSRVEDFSGSDAYSRHFRVEEDSGSLLFGDGIHGRIPDGDIFLLGFARTLGTEGNVKENKISRILSDNLPEDAKVWNIENASGGKDAEPIAECFRRAARYLEHPDCAVTDRDYENYAMHTPGLMIEACKVIRTDLPGNAVTLVVKPFHPEKKCRMGRTYENNIRAYLEPYRLAGSRIRFLPAEYIPVRVIVQLVKQSRYRDAGVQVRKAVEEYFRAKECGFGQALEYGDLYGMLDRLPCVSSVRTLSVEVTCSRAVHLAGGDILIPQNGLLYLQEIQDTYLSEE